MGFQKGVCYLCSEKCGSLNAVDGNVKSFLHTLLKIELTLTQGPVICKNCEEMLIKCFNFKATCLRNMHHYVNKEDDVRLGLKSAYLKEDASGTGISKDQDICVFCGDSAQTLCLDVDRGDIILEKMIERCLPEIDLSIFKKPVICTSCRRSLEDWFHLMATCSTEKYCETLDVKSEGQTELSNVLHCTMRDVTSEVGGIPFEMVKIEEQFCEDIESSDVSEVGSGLKTTKLEQMFFDSREDASDDIENKNERFFMETEDQKFKNERQVAPKNIACEEERNKLGSIIKEEIFCEVEIKEIKENPFKMEGQTFLTDEEVEIKTDEHHFKGSEDGVFPHTEVSSRLLGSPTHLMPSLDENLLKSCVTHTLTDKHISEERMNEYCSSQTKNKYDPKSNLAKEKDTLHVPILKCSSCSSPKFNRYLKEHLLSHKGPLELVLQCDSCSLQSKKLKQMRENPAEVKIYKCDSCPFQTKSKFYHKKHALVHKDPSEVKMYKCCCCSFQTKHKNSLDRHLQKHKDPSEVKMYQCESCSFQAKTYYYFKKHLTVHKLPQETFSIA